MVFDACNPLSNNATTALQRAVLSGALGHSRSDTENPIALHELNEPSSHYTAHETKRYYYYYALCHRQSALASYFPACARSAQCKKIKRRRQACKLIKAISTLGEQLQRLRCRKREKCLGGGKEGLFPRVAAKSSNLAVTSQGSDSVGNHVDQSL